MKPLLLILTVLLLIGGCNGEPPIEGNATCNDFNGFLPVLNLNVLFTEAADWDTYEKHLLNIADFISDEDVYIVLLQEMVGGSLAGIDNSAEELRKILLVYHNLDFNITTAWEIGEDQTYSSANVVLSRCKIIESDVEKISTPGTIGALDMKPKAIRASRNVHLARIDMPDFGEINVYNIHTCARCPKSERVLQIERALTWMEKQDSAPFSFFGGDLNFDYWHNYGESEWEGANYEMILGAGWIDSYKAGQTDSLKYMCEDSDTPDKHCTKGVSKLDTKNGRRIDYIFHTPYVEIIRSQVVFNEIVDPQQPTVSDHAGVYVRFKLEP